MATKNAKVENVNKVIALNVCVNDLMSVATEAKNGKMYANIIVSNRSKADDYGNTLCAFADKSSSDEDTHFVGNGRIATKDTTARLEHIVRLNVNVTELDAVTEPAKNGKKYANIIGAHRKEADKYGNTLFAYISQTHEERNEKKDRHFVGNGNEIIREQANA